MPVPRPLRPGEASRTLAQRLAPRVDRLRQISTRFGLRSRRVFMVWTRYTGAERGEGREKQIQSVEILPTPKLSELTSIALSPYSAGIIPVGSVRIENVSAQFSEDELLGKRVPATSGKPGAEIQEPYDFFYEMYEDARVDSVNSRLKFRVLGNPTRREGNVSWTVLLERISEDRAPDGRSNYLENVDG